MQKKLKILHRETTNPHNSKFNISLPTKKNTMVDYTTWRNLYTKRSDQRAAKLFKGSQSLRTLLHNLSKKKKDGQGRQSDRESEKSDRFYKPNKDFIIKGLVSKMDPTDTCEIKVIGERETFCFKHKLTNVRNLYQILGSSKANIIGYHTIPENMHLDYYLTLKSKSIQFLNGDSLILSPIPKIIQDKISLSSFEIVKCIGTGGFSKVFLCRFKETGVFYAMKVIDKEFIIKNKKKKIVMNERNIMIELKHPFLIEMKFAFESKESLIFVLELCPGGELFSLVKKFRMMNEEVAKFYMIEILLGLEEIHKNHIIYRDFKPQNILIDMQGHIRIADFGLAKPNIETKKTKAFSFCGSPQYMPPEMIMKKGHSFPVDFYCLGAMLYELVTGLPPFYSRNADEIYEGTISKEIVFPKHAKLSQELKSLLRQLLCKDQAHRLGSYMGVKQVFAHPWFQKINKEHFLNKKVEPPVSFSSYRDVNFQFEGTSEENATYVNEIIEQQKRDKKSFSKVMDNFYYDFRQKHKNVPSFDKQNPFLRRCSQESKKSKKKYTKEVSGLTHRSKTSLQKLRPYQPQQFSCRCLNINNFIK